jgi:hypothetical protein
MYKLRKNLRFKRVDSRRALTKARNAAGLPPRRRGGQPGNSNRLIHGRYTRRFVARRAHICSILREARQVIAEVNLARHVTAVAWRLLALGSHRRRVRNAPTGALTAPTEAPVRSPQ